jgi:hypothetical protein
MTHYEKMPKEAWQQKVEALVAAHIREHERYIETWAKAGTSLQITCPACHQDTLTLALLGII